MSAGLTLAPSALAASDPDKGESLIELSAVEAVARMRRGEMTVERYAAAWLSRCESLRALNAFITLEPAQVLEAARASDKQRGTGGELGPLFGLPIPVKDSVNTKDYPTTAGTPALSHFRPADLAVEPRSPRVTDLDVAPHRRRNASFVRAG